VVAASVNVPPTASVIGLRPSKNSRSAVSTAAGSDSVASGEAAWADRVSSSVIAPGIALGR
jgi:hypothetical protein